MEKKGLLITLEGIDGSGKTSAAHALYALLKKEYPVILTKEPGATPLGKQLRQLLQLRTFAVTAQAEFLLFAADRAQHISEQVLPALEQGFIVISDRLADSSRAYQGFGRGLDDTWIEQINSWALQGVRPDLTLYLALDYQTAIARLSDRHEKTVFEQEQAAFFKRVIKGFETIFAQRQNVVTIDASLEESAVHKQVYNVVQHFLKECYASFSISMDRASSGS